MVRNVFVQTVWMKLKSEIQAIAIRGILYCQNITPIVVLIDLYSRNVNSRFVASLACLHKRTCFSFNFSKDELFQNISKLCILTQNMNTAKNIGNIMAKMNCWHDSWQEFLSRSCQQLLLARVYSHLSNKIFLPKPWQGTFIARFHSESRPKSWRNIACMVKRLWNWNNSAKTVLRQTTFERLIIGEH